jgi:twitching motility protein PilT
VNRKKVLIVHDDAAAARQIANSLAASAPGLEVNAVLSASRCLGAVAADRPDAIIVDAELVGVDGYTLTQKLRSDGETTDIPVIIVSMEPTEASALRARQVGAAAHLAALGSPEALVDKVIALTGFEPVVAEPEPAIGQQTASAVAQSVPQVVGVAVPQGEAVQSASASTSPAPATPAAQSSTPEIPEPLTPPAVPPVVPPPVPPVAAVPAAQAGTPQGASPPVAAIPPTATQADSAGPAPVAGYGGPVATPVTGVPSDSAQAPEGTGGAGVDVVSTPPDAPAPDLPHIDDLLRMMLERSGSDLHITVGSPPAIRERGELVPVDSARVLQPRDTQELILNMLSEEQRRRFETELELDFAYSIPGVSRFRCNVFQQRNSMGAVFRVIPLQIPTIEDLGLPKVCRYLAERPRGLVLVTGPTGSGKSTTLAAMIDHINDTRPVHIVTLEDPIEFVHRNKVSYVNQREVGEDTHSFASALKRVLRQDPDVILVGEMRDLETIAAAITAAETGHLVLATLHTTGGPESVDRIIDVFPPHQQQQVRIQLSTTLEGVLSQTLLRSTDGRSRVMAMEVMLGVPAISNLIREGKTHQMAAIIQGGAQLGMQTLDQHLKVLLQGGRVAFEEAMSKAKNPEELADMVGRKM